MGDPLWYKDAVIYEAHVRAFQDSDGDGLGDFPGLTQRLDYLQDLGVTAVWLLPFYPSPLRDDGYDISDYTGVHSHYGTLNAFQEFLGEAHRRGLRVITELVLNHTSDQHPWFQRARRSPRGSPERDFYVWCDAPDKELEPRRYGQARLIFPDFEQSNWAWDPLARSYYWHRFYSHQPDLNYDNPRVQQAILPIVDFWLEMGVDGLRLDAVPYLYEREGTSCENLPETYGFLKALRRHVDEKFEDRMLLAEANQWPEDAAAYFGDGDECHMAFHFPLMPRMFMAMQMEDRLPIIDILAQTPQLPPNCQWALFLRNHDELTLEMVTDEERDYMRRVYARDPQARVNLGIRRRLAPLMGNHRRRIELMNALLFSMPGTPIVYYGDEIGMGDNIYLGDRDGVRTPMQWGPDRNAGFSRANPQSLYLPVIIDPEYHYEAVNVESQQNNPHSLLSWMKRIVSLRKRYQAFGRGSIEFLQPDNHRVLAFVRRHRDERILVVANLSRFTQHAHLDLSEFAGTVPTELFGRVRFPPVGQDPYFMMLGPHSFQWFAMEPQRPERVVEQTRDDRLAPPRLTVEGRWETVLERSARAALEAALKSYIDRRQFGRDPQRLRFVEIEDVVPFGGGCFVLLNAEAFEGVQENHVVPLAFAEGERQSDLLSRRPEAVIAHIRGKSSGILYDATEEREFCHDLLQFIASGDSLLGSSGQMLATKTWLFDSARGPQDVPLQPSTLKVRQSNTSIVYGERLILKLLRRVDEGINPGLEIGRRLTEMSESNHAPRVAGALEYRRGRREPITLAILHEYVEHQSDGWQHARDALDRFYRQAGQADDESAPAPADGALLDCAEREIPPYVEGLIGTYLDSARLIGRRTAELHVLLSTQSDDESFTPEPLSFLDQRSMYQSMRSRLGRVVRLLQRRLADLPRGHRSAAEELISGQPTILRHFRSVLRRGMAAQRTRIHGDYHLQQLLWTGTDFVIIDFEGEPTRSLSVRRLKHSPLSDVVSMIWSLHYAAWFGAERMQGEVRDDGIRLDRLHRWRIFWHGWTAAACLRAYLDAAAQASFLPRTRVELCVLLNALLIERGLHDLEYQLHNRTQDIPATLDGLQHVQQLVGPPQPA